MSKLIKSLRFLLYPLYFFSFFQKREKSIWLFGAHHGRYAENSKALFEYVSLHAEEIDAVWISNDGNLCKYLNNKSLKAYKKWSLNGIKYGLKAKYYFYNVYSDDINFYTSGRATLVNLWHGIPLKKIEFDAQKGSLALMFNSKYMLLYAFFKPYIFRNPDFVLSTSPLVSSLLSSALRVPLSNCLELGYPRCDSFFRTKVQFEKEKEVENIIYIPTWRATNMDFLSDAIPDFLVLNKRLENNNLRLFIKLHPNMKTNIYDNYSHIIFEDEKKDLYDMIQKSDYLITDYSSIYFDYLLLDKEIIFYPFDYASYVNDERELYFPYGEVTPGIKIYNFLELLKILDGLKSLDYKKERDLIREKFWTYKDANASYRIYSYFKEL